MMIKPKIAKIQDSYLKPKSLLTTTKEILRIKPVTTSCQWKDLSKLEIHNENVLISHFHDVHPFPNPPIFTNAKNIIMDNTYHYFHYYWINKKIFPTMPKFYIDGYISYAFLLEQGYEMYLTDFWYGYANKISPNNNLVKSITTQDFNDIVNSYEEEPLNATRYEANEKFIRPDDDAIKECDGIPAALIKRMSGW